MVIGITGTLGAGKGVVAEYLTKHHKFTYFSIRNFYAAEVVKSGKMANRETISEAASLLKSQHGPNYALEQLFASNPKGNVVVESIRTKGEAEFLKQKGDALWAVTADIKTRYNRTLEHNRSTGSGAISFEQFQAQEENDTSVAEVMSHATVVLDNGGTKEQLFEQVEAALLTSGFIKQV